MLSLVLTSTLLVLTVVPAQGLPRIFISGDRCGLSCYATADDNDIITVYVLAQQAASGEREVMGAEYRLSGLPSDWIGTVESAADGVQFVGDPFGDGAIITFDRCRSVDNYNVVLLQTLRVLALTQRMDQVLRVEAARPPINLLHTTSMLYLCTGSEVVMTESESVEVQLNPVSYICHVDEPYPGPICASVAVERFTWSAVRRLYEK